MTRIVNYMRSLANEGTFQTLDINGEGFISEFKPLDPFPANMFMKNNINDKYYFTLLKKGGNPNQRGTRVYEISQNGSLSFCDVPLPGDVVSVYDAHMASVIDFDSEGYVYVIREKGKPTSTNLSDGHATDFYVYKSIAPNSIASGFSHISTVPGSFTYPKFWIYGNNMAVGGRNSTARFDIALSDDLGQSFGGVYSVYNSGSSQLRAYNIKLFSEDGKYYVIINERDDVTKIFVTVCLLKSEDFITWTNAEGTFSKNVVTSGAIDRAELFANCVVYDSPDHITQVGLYEGGTVKANGDINVLVSGGIPTGNVIDGNAETVYNFLRLYTFSNGSWSYNSLTILNYFINYGLYTRCVVFNKGLNYDYIYLVDLDDNHTLKRYRSNNNFASHEEEILYPGNNNYYMGTVCGNTDDQLVIMPNVVTDIFDLNDYSNLVIIKK